ncbi:MAG: hypothetical protein ONA90_05655, partial [candidate division KSB1 bacterium]|nr:hypothetical protein [candidate division KSB1 bacterium]
RYDRCLQCRGREFQEIHPQGNATLLTYTILYSLPSGFDQRMLILGVAEFENRIRALGQVRAASLDQLRSGMALKANWGPIRRFGETILHGLILEPLE